MLQPRKVGPELRWVMRRRDSLADLPVGRMARASIRGPPFPSGSTGQPGGRSRGNKPVSPPAVALYAEPGKRHISMQVTVAGISGGFPGVRRPVSGAFPDRAGPGRGSPGPDRDGTGRTGPGRRRGTPGGAVSTGAPAARAASGAGRSAGGQTGERRRSGQAQDHRTGTGSRGPGARPGGSGPSQADPGSGSRARPAVRRIPPARRGPSRRGGRRRRWSAGPGGRGCGTSSGRPRGP